MCGKQPFYLLLCTLRLTGFGIDHNYHLIAILVQTFTYLWLSLFLRTKGVRPEPAF